MKSTAITIAFLALLTVSKAQSEEIVQNPVVSLKKASALAEKPLTRSGYSLTAFAPLKVEHYPHRKVAGFDKAEMPERLKETLAQQKISEPYWLFHYRRTRLNTKVEDYRQSGLLVIIQPESNSTIIDLQGIRLPGDKTTPETPLPKP